MLRLFVDDDAEILLKVVLNTITLTLDGVAKWQA
jgi:hypothetical protein